MEYLRKIRIEKGVSQQTVADYLGITRQAYSNYENGNRTPDTENLLKLAEFFGVSVDNILRGYEKTPVPGLTTKDERDISKKLEETLRDLEEQQDALMFDGEPMDNVTRELLIASLRNSMEIGKRLAKEKFTPKKYRK